MNNAEDAPNAINMFRLPPGVVPVTPGPGQESVWAYPRPPRLEETTRHLVVVLGGVTIADTRRAWRVLETSHPPVYYLPPDDVALAHFTPSRSASGSFCEWKGAASYYDVMAGGKSAPRSAWFYPDPTPPFAPIQNYIALYPSAMDACFVDGEPATPQPGGFYGGWITLDVVGPFKGVPNSQAW